MECKVIAIDKPTVFISQGFTEKFLGALGCKKVGHMMAASNLMQEKYGTMTRYNMKSHSKGGLSQLRMDLITHRDWDKQEGSLRLASAAFLNMMQFASGEGLNPYLDLAVTLLSVYGYGSSLVYFSLALTQVYNIARVDRVIEEYSHRKRSG